jgi:hypothetical protein
MTDGRTGTRTSAFWSTFARRAGRDHELTPVARHLLLLLAAGVDWQSGENTWSTAQVMADLGRQRSAYHRALRELVEHGLVEHYRAAPGRRAMWALLPYDDDPHGPPPAVLCSACGRTDAVRAGREVDGSACAEPIASAQAEPIGVDGSAQAEANACTDPPSEPNASALRDKRFRVGGQNGSAYAEPLSLPEPQSSKSSTPHAPQGVRPDSVGKVSPVVVDEDGSDEERAARQAVDAFVAEHPPVARGLGVLDAHKFATGHFPGEVQAEARDGARLYGRDRVLVTAYVTAARGGGWGVVESDDPLADPRSQRPPS